MTEVEMDVLMRDTRKDLEQIVATDYARWCTRIRGTDPDTQKNSIRRRISMYLLRTTVV